MSKLVPLKCSVCGANLSPETLTCDYCGTQFVLSEEKVAVQAKLEDARDISVTEEHATVAKEDLEYAGEDYFGLEGYIDYYNVTEHDFDLDDRVKRKILKYINETGRRQVDALNKKYYEYTLARDKLRKRLKLGEIDEDTFEDLLKEAKQKHEEECKPIDRLLDAKRALYFIRKFINESIKRKSNDFRDIKSVNRIVFSSIDGKVSEDSFVYKVTGFINCVLKSGMFSTKPCKKYFSAEVDYKTDYNTGRPLFFRWEPNNLLNVQEYRARPLPLPKFI